MNKTRQAKLYSTDIEFVKEHFNKSIAEVFNTLLWGTKGEAFKETVREIIREEIERIQPYLKERMDKLEDSVKDKLELIK